MTLKCSLANCYVPASACDIGLSYQECPYWKQVNKTAPEVAAGVEEGNRLPWTGNTLGEMDLRFVTGAAQPQVVGIIGAFNAGKTTLLTTLYLLMGRGYKPSGYSFAGSYTLGGWENLAHHLRHANDSPPTFPPHTTSNQGRRPGLLHLSLRPDDNVNQSLLDVLLTDAPGEWFERWAVDKTNSQAEGARWLAEHANSFALVADSEALSGPERGLMRHSLRQLAKRLSVEARGRPIALVWAKSDALLKPELRAELDRELAAMFPLFRTFEISVKKPEVDAESLRQNDSQAQRAEDEVRMAAKAQEAIEHVIAPAFMELLAWLLQRPAPPPFEPVTSEAGRQGSLPALDVLLAYRGR